MFFKSVEEENQEEMDQERMNIDYDLARILIEDVIPFSLEYYLGISVENEDYNEEESSEENYEDLDKKKGKGKKKSLSKTNVKNVKNVKIIVDEYSDISDEKSSKKKNISSKN